MTYSERLCAAQNAALERAYMASLEPGDYYYSDWPDDEDQDRRDRLTAALELGRWPEQRKETTHETEP